MEDEGATVQISRKAFDLALKMLNTYAYSGQGDLCVCLIQEYVDLLEKDLEEKIKQIGALESALERTQKKGEEDDGTQGNLN